VAGIEPPDVAGGDGGVGLALHRLPAIRPEPCLRRIDRVLRDELQAAAIARHGRTLRPRFLWDCHEASTSAERQYRNTAMGPLLGRLTESGKKGLA
jgi:hypothetical protein